MRAARGLHAARATVLASPTTGAPPETGPSMSTIAPAALDPDAAAERLIEEAVTFAEYLSVSLGLELGLYAALDEGGPATARDLAERTGIAPRYAREWLEQQTAAGYLSCEDPSAAPDDRRFTLPEGFRAVLLDPDSGAYLGPLVAMARGVVGAYDELGNAYRTGTGVAYAAYGEGIRHGIGELNGATFDAAIPDWIATMPDVADRLATTESPRILDLGCGIGRSSLALARAFPRASVRGVDLDAGSVEDARAAAATAGLAHRVTFTQGDAAEVRSDERFDLVTIFEALHDMGDPVGALSAARASLAPGGVVYLVDEKVADEFTPDADLVERLQYGFSVLHCLPATMAEDPVTAHGTVLRAPTVREWAAAAGFASVTDLAIDDLFWRHYRLDA